jgi:ABC-type phosphate transport system substrate-binding protein
MRLTKILVASAFGLAAAAMAAGPVLADPPAGTTPAATDIVSVGSDTTQVVSNQFSVDFNATSPSSKYYSWDATGTTPITPKSGATSITRPNGSGAGITELTSVTHTTVDIARSSRGPKVGTDPSTDLFIAFAKDAVGFSAFTGGNAPATLSVADLQAIYGTCTITKWNQILDIPGYTGGTSTIKAYLPQASSGTRSFFLQALGITTPGTCVQATTPEENEGTNAAFTGNVDALFPYSIAHYVAQKYKGKSSGTDAPGALDALRSIKFSATSTIAQVDTVNQKINASFATSAFGRNVYNVVRSADWTDPTLGPRLKALLDTAANNGWICKNGATDITGFGFLTLAGTQCGTQSHT